MVSLFRLIVLFLCCFHPAYAWNNIGHKLIAAIAYKHLTPASKEMVNGYLKAKDEAHAVNRFMNRAIWLDNRHAPKEFWMKSLHYIDIPFSLDNTTLMQEKKVNAVSATQKACVKLKNPETTQAEKTLAFNILIHVVGDLHQPMHAVSKFSQRQPKGDKGGNLHLLKANPIAPNLHSYWDRGGGFLLDKKLSPKKIGNSPRHPDPERSEGEGSPAIGTSSSVWHSGDPSLRIGMTWGVTKIDDMANTLLQTYPCNPGVMAQNPEIWAKESHAIAVEYAYTTKTHYVPSQKYQQMVEAISRERIALAGCRLAAVLNGLSGG